jgi:uncharacterized SAM-binding protein YcdF (DUF218 family)
MDAGLIVLIVGLALFVVGLFLDVLLPDFGRKPEHRRRATAAAGQQPGALSRLVDAIIWAFKPSWKELMDLIKGRGKHNAGQKFMIAGLAFSLLGLVFLLAEALIDAGDDGGDGSTTATATGTTATATTP